MSEAKSTTTENARTAEQGSNASIADFGRLVAHHRAYFQSGATRSVEWRESQLIALRSMMKGHAEDFYAALWTDLRRNRVEADWVDVKYMTSEIDHTLAHLRHWMKPVSASTPFALTPSHVQVRFDPLGVGLIIGTWNYPLMLLLSPLVAAIAAGNAAVIKRSEVSAATADVIARFIPQYMDRDAFSVVLGAAPETTALLEQEWDHLFFTGGTTVAKLVMTAAAKHLTPVVLELGGKNPTIVHSSANLLAPTVLVNVSPDSPAMQEEIFGPILPVLEVDNVREVIDFVNARPSPLGLYLFSEDESVTEQILNSTTSGDAGVNECTLQPIVHDLPFGGVGNSGMGKYHGEWGFRAYTNARGVLYHSTSLDFSALRYPPYDHNRRLREFVIPS
jgi:acyl-CoA reductase-like NAD-dependent aldehyde dehydrogenase